MEVCSERAAVEPLTGHYLKVRNVYDAVAAQIANRAVLGDTSATIQPDLVKVDDT
jgi:hypothetical protein